MKKFKLFLSICMMCLCVAVLCIGILAASSATYNITGLMTYNMTADLAKINTRVYRVAGKSTKNTLTSNVATLSTMTYAQIERDTSITYIEHQRLSTLNAISETSTEQQYSSEAISMTFGEIEKEDECYYTYYIVISIVNKSTDGTLTATLNDTIASDTTFYRYTNSTQTGIANGETKNIVIAISKIDDTEMTEQTFTYTLTVSCDESWPIELQADTTNNYWYVELGTYNSSPVKWRLVSVDGTTKYTDFDATNKPRYIDLKGKAIFVQETTVGTTFFSCMTSGSYVTTESKIIEDNNTSSVMIYKCEIGNFSRSKDLFVLPDLYNINYFESNLRAQLMYGTVFGFTSVNEIPSFVFARDIQTIAGYYSTVSTYTKTDGLNDYFWALSRAEIETYLGSETWDVCDEIWWTRTPGDVYMVYAIGLNGDSAFCDPSRSYNIRAAFQLA